MTQETAFLSQLRQASPEALAVWIKHAGADQQRLFEEYYGTERFQRIRNAVLRSSDVVTRGPKAARAEKQGNVVIIPGIMGSELSLSEGGGAASVLWMSIIRLFVLGRFGHLTLAPDGVTPTIANVQFTASGLLRKYYDELEQRLLGDWNVRHFAYDWRKDLRASAAQLDAFLETEFGDEPVHIVAHSLGGLVSRALLLRRKKAGRSVKKLLGGGRLIMLGTPNYGSYEMPQILTGLQESIRQCVKAVRAASFFRKSEADALRDVLSVVNSFPAVYQMLPAPDKIESDEVREKLYRATTYSALGVDVMENHFQRALDTHDELAAAIFPEIMIYIAGCHPSQPTAIGIDNLAWLRANVGYKFSNAGDGRVSHELGQLPGVKTYFVSGDHGGLPENPVILNALGGLLLPIPRTDLSEKADEPSGAGGTRGAAATPVARTSEPTDELWRRVLAEPEIAGNLTRGGRGTKPAICDTPPESLPPPTPAQLALEERLTAGLLGPGQPDVAADEPGPVPPAVGPPGEGAGIAGPAPSAPSSPVVEIEIEIVVAGIESDEILTGAAFGDRPPSAPVDCLAVGHYKGVRPDGAEWKLDSAVSRGLRELAGETNLPGDLPEAKRIFHQATARGLFRGELGEVFLVEDARSVARGPARTVALVGMGPPGEFGGPELAMLVRQTAWTMGFLGRKHLATVVIGGRRGGLSPEVAIQGWLRGIARAVAEMPKVRREIQSLRKLTFVEYYIDRAFLFESALRHLAKRPDDAPRDEEFVVTVDDVRFRIRPWPINRRENLQARFREQCGVASEKAAAKLGDANNPDSNEESLRLTVESTPQRSRYRFALLTEDASIPEREVVIDERIIEEASRRLVAQSNLEDQLKYGEFLVRLLLPRDFRKELQRRTPISLIVDSTTARIPWEMLTTLTGPLEGEKKNEERFLSLGRRLTRQFRTIFAPTPDPLLDGERNLHVLIVADPAEHAPLEGAREEAVLIADLFEAYNSSRTKPDSGLVRYKLLVGPREAQRVDVLREVMLNHYDVLHYAGHCFFDEQNPAQSGWIFGVDKDGKEELLTATELDRIDRVPRIVFSNACESGITPDRADERNASLAPTFAEAFFKQGVQNFICTGWPVNDRAAREFALRVYAGLLRMNLEVDADGDKMRFVPGGRYCTLSESLREARRQIAPTQSGRRTWGAYQHYGNPEFRFFPEDADPGKAAPAPASAPAAAPQGGAGGGQAPAPPQPKGQANFPAVRGAIDKQQAHLRREYGAISVRPGYRFTNGWITNDPAMVAVVPPGKEYPMDLVLDGVPVDFAPATPAQLLAGTSTLADRSRDELRAIGVPSLGEDLLLPGEQWSLQAPREEERKRVITHPYKPPANLKKKLKPALVDRVVCHLSPDKGWQVLEEFLKETQQELVLGMYDLTAPHVLGALKSLRSPRKLKLVLDPGQALDKGGDPKKNSKANDVDEDDVVKELRSKLRKRFVFAWAAVKVKDKTSGSTFPSAYHIKVAVRDGESFWLSSGNMQSSNQPADAEDFANDLPALFNRYNREWHVVIDSAPLAETFRGFLEFDLESAEDVQVEVRGAARIAVPVPQLFVPEDEDEVRAPKKLAVFSELILKSTTKQPLEVMPLLTPDNYAREVLKVIRQAKKKLFFQNQYIKIGKELSEEFAELLEALKEKMNELDDARIILRKLPPGEMVETLIDQGFPAEKIRLMPNTHTKGIIIDSQICVLGSHNWSSDGTTANRDASLIFSDERIAQYYERAFLHDWDGRAKPQVFSTRTMPRPVDGERGVPRGAAEPGAAVPWGALFEDE